MSAVSEQSEYQRGWADGRRHALSSPSPDQPIADGAVSVYWLAEAIRLWYVEVSHDRPVASWVAQRYAQLRAVRPETHEPGDHHRYRIECEVCGQRGTIRLSVDPDLADLAVDVPLAPVRPEEPPE